MRVVGRIDKHSVAVLLDLPEIEWYWECPACGTESYSMRSDWEHDSARTHAVVCDSLRLQRLLDDLGQAVELLDRWADGDLVVVAPREMTLHLVGRAAGSRRACGIITDLLARHRGAS